MVVDDFNNELSRQISEMSGGSELVFSDVPNEPMLHEIEDHDLIEVNDLDIESFLQGY